jgi:hypothetical protein
MRPTCISICSWLLLFTQISATNKIDCDNCRNSVKRPVMVREAPICSRSSYLVYVNCVHTSFIVNYIIIIYLLWLISFSILNIIVPFCYVNYYIVCLIHLFSFLSFIGRDHCTKYFCYSLFQQHTFFFLNLIITNFFFFFN